MAGLIGIWGLFAFRLSRTLAPLLVLLVLFNIGGMLALTQSHLYSGGPLYMAVSLFLGLTSVFYAAMIERRPHLLETIANAYIAAAVLTSFLGICAYFGAIPGGLFVRYGRAAGGFEDPNVFGPFLVFPAAYTVHQLLTGSAAKFPLRAGILAILAMGLLLSFSRGAWGLFSLAMVLMVTVLLLKNQSSAFRLRILTLSLIAFAVVVVMVVILLQIPAVAELFEARAKLVQNYDGARLGRFARYIIGFQLAAERPLGIGPLEFGLTFGEDTHNIWLKTLMDYGWLGFVSYLGVIVWTLAAGFRNLLLERPWQPFLLCAYVTLIGHILLGTVIDTDHWRHFFLLLGLVWGCLALEARHRRARRL
jgi:O-antigen ligase